MKAKEMHFFILMRRAWFWHVASYLYHIYSVTNTVKYLLHLSNLSKTALLHDRLRGVINKKDITISDV